ncbi:MAG: DUF2752 domain-containing protein [Chthonomonas sp.]|nr:DUF2752 domain-containing protein [Chthonomonas sp.]
MVSFDPKTSRRKLGGQLAWFLLWAFVTACGIWLAPNPQGHGTHQQLGLPPCPSVFLFGRLCPGCGLTTSFTAVIHGDLKAAWSANPFGVLGYPIFTLSAWACLYGFVKERRFNTDSKTAQWLMGSFAAAFIAFGIYRVVSMPVPSGLDSITQTR